VSYYYPSLDGAQSSVKRSLTSIMGRQQAAQRGLIPLVDMMQPTCDPHNPWLR
jgi:hypothetical protein